MVERYGLRPDLDEMRQAAATTSLRRTLTWRQLTGLGVGAIVGAGVFSVIGSAASLSGPAIVLSFLIAAFVALLAALCYAELASMLPLGGSAYTYAYVAGGELFGWLVGVALMLSYGIGNAAIASTFSDNFSAFYNGFVAEGWRIPDAWTATPSAGGIADLPAVVLVVLATLVLLRPVRESATVNAVLVAVKLGVLALFLVFALPAADRSNLVPFAPGGTSGIITGSALIFFSFLGFDAVSTAAEETRDPKRDIPLGILGSLAVVTLLFVLIGFALTAVVPVSELDTGEPLAVALRALGLTELAAVMNFGAVVATATVFVVFQLATARVVLALARDGLVPKRFAKVSARHGTPNRVTLALGAVVAVTAALVPLRVLVILTNLTALFIFAAAMLALIVLRKTAPDAPRPFRTPWVPLVPIVGILSCATLTVYTVVEDPASGWGYVAWIGAALMVYAVYGARRSALRQARALP